MRRVGYGGAGSTDRHPYDVQVTTSQKAQARMRAKKVTVKVAAFYSGPPISSKLSMANEVGEIVLGYEASLVPVEGGSVTMKGAVSRQKWGWVSPPGVLLNVVSSGVDHGGSNLLDCTPFQDSFDVAQKQTIKIHCKLINE